MNSWKFSLIIAAVVLSYGIQSFSMFRVENFRYEIRDDKEIAITHMDLCTEYSSLTNLSGFKPGMDSISIVGIVEGFSTCGFDGTKNFKALLGKIQLKPQMKFGVIQIGPLSVAGKEALKSSSNYYEQVIEALRRAKILTFGDKVYDTECDFDVFAENFKNSLMH